VENSCVGQDADMYMHRDHSNPPGENYAKSSPVCMLC
jgi:hypothetical protein